MDYNEIKSISQEYAEMMAKYYPEIREKTKFRDKMAQAENIIRLLLQKYDVIPKCGIAKKQTVTIEAWVARNKPVAAGSNADLVLGKERPTLCHDMWCNMEEYYPLPQDALPSITFENSPKKVKVTIEMEEEK